jgi:hypothetical protein
MEHLFRAIKRQRGLTKARIQGPTKNTAQR